MTVLAEVHEDHDATFRELSGRRIVAHYGQPASAHRAIRNVVGVTEHPYDILEISGEDRIEYVDNAISNEVPGQDDNSVYALLLNPQGRIETDMYVYNAGERLLVFLPPGEGQPLAEEWREKTFIQDVDIAVATEDYATFGVHGAKATEKVASVFSKQTPDEQLTFVRGSIGGTGVTAIRTDGLTGEEGYEIICAVADATKIFDALENQGLNAAPFGYETWESLTLEAGTPLFETELADSVPNNLGLRNAIDFEKGCFVGQEVVSRVENRGRSTKRLVGLTAEAVPDAGATVFAGDETAGEITRAVESPSLREPIALALVDHDVGAQIADSEKQLSVRVDGKERAATGVELPFVEGSDQSARLPTYLSD
jgi:aminomethyltransferase